MGHSTINKPTLNTHLDIRKGTRRWKDVGNKARNQTYRNWRMELSSTKTEVTTSASCDLC